MTESSCIMSMTQYPEQDDTGSVGRMLPNCDLKFVDDDGREVSTVNPRGEMCVRGPGVIRGYYQNPEANASSFDADGFYHSGDVGYLDSATGKIYIVDRKKELIKVRGFQVAPAEIEGVLLSHPKIVDAAVIGLHDSSNAEAELPRAYVVLRPGEQMTETEAIDFAGARLAKYKRLEGGVKFVDAIPKTASGKILKRLLREVAKKEKGPKL